MTVPPAKPSCVFERMHLDIGWTAVETLLNLLTGFNNGCDENTLHVFHDARLNFHWFLTLIFFLSFIFFYLELRLLLGFKCLNSIPFISAQK